MALFEDKHYGNYISEGLSKYLIKFTSMNERREAAKHTGVGYSTLRDVMFRQNVLTKRNGAAIITLMTIAMKNVAKEKQATRQAEQMFNKWKSKIIEEVS